MDQAREARRVGPAVRRSGGVHAGRISSEQRVHLAAVLIGVLWALPARAQEIAFDPLITPEQFRTFSGLVGQVIYATPVEPASARSLLGFDIGVSATAIAIDENAAYWLNAVDSDLSTSGYLLLPRLVVSKGLGRATVAASAAMIPDTDYSVYGASLDVPIIRGGVVTPALTLRGSYSMLNGVEVYDLNSYGAELFISKGFGPLTPYAAAGMTRVSAEGRVVREGFPLIHLVDEFDHERYTVGVRISMLVPKLVVEASQGEELTYSVKVSFGL